MFFQFDDLRLLNEKEEYHWGNVTERRIKSELENAGGGVLEQLVVEMEIMKQEQEPLRRLEGRLLQVKRPMNLTSISYVSFRTPQTITDNQITTFVGEAFNNPSDRNAYLDELQSRLPGETDGVHETFSTINSLWVDVNGVRQDAPESVSSPLANETRGVNMAFIIGPIAGGLCALLLTGCFVLRRRKASGSEGSESPSGDQRVSSVIEVEPQDEISTLGDPTFAPGMMFAAGMERDDTVTESIVSAGDYDYTRAYGGGGPGSVSTAGRCTSSLSREGSGVSTGRSSGNFSNEVVRRVDSSSLFSDDASFEKQFKEDGRQIKVLAPPGKLGVVIDRPFGSVPIVHAIKDTSVLADQIRVGDKLLSVDGEDTTSLSAIEVSKLISMKADRPSRLLVFLRMRDAEEP